jgi:hypothetical protein
MVCSSGDTRSLSSDAIVDFSANQPTDWRKIADALIDFKLATLRRGYQIGNENALIASLDPIWQQPKAGPLPIRTKCRDLLDGWRVFLAIRFFHLADIS